MPRFAIKDLFLATTLIAFGIGMLTIVVRESDYLSTQLGYDVWYILYLLWIAGGSLIGAGLFTPFRHPWVGGAIGGIIQVVWPLVLIFIVNA